MKKWVLCLTMCFGFWHVLEAQFSIDSIVHPADSVHREYDKRMEDMFENVDMSYVPSGVLYDRGFSFINLDLFQGELNDSSKSMILSFGLAYASIYSMTVLSPGGLPDPIHYRNRMDDIDPITKIIPIAGLHQEYHKMDTLSIENNLLSLSGDNLYDVFPRTESPYNKHELFLFAPAIHEINGSTLNFILDSDLFYTNTAKTVQEIAIDMDNDSGFVETNLIN